MKTTKHLSTAAAAIALVSAIGLAYAQTESTPTTQQVDPSAPAVVQQQDSTEAVREGTSATPDWRPQDLNAAPTTTEIPAPQSTTEAPADSTLAAPAPAEQSTSANTTDNGSMTADTTAATPAPDTTTSSEMITERAPQADRN